VKARHASALARPLDGVVRRELGRALLWAACATRHDVRASDARFATGVRELRIACALCPEDAEAAWLLGCAQAALPPSDSGDIERVLPGMWRHLRRSELELRDAHGGTLLPVMRLVYGKASWTLCKLLCTEGVELRFCRAYFDAAVAMASCAAGDVSGTPHAACCAELLFETTVFGCATGAYGVLEGAARFRDAVAMHPLLDARRVAILAMLGRGTKRARS
jgi:hypothetical protein